MLTIVTLSTNSAVQFYCVEPERCSVNLQAYSVYEAKFTGIKSGKISEPRNHQSRMTSYSDGVQAQVDILFSYQGDGNAASQCQYTYTNHHKSVLSIGFCERTRVVASCDSVIHLWDPFIGRLVSVVRNGYPVNTLVPLPTPNATIIAANTHASLNVLDTRTASYVSELKVSFTFLKQMIQFLFRISSVMVIK